MVPLHQRQGSLAGTPLSRHFWLVWLMRWGPRGSELSLIVDRSSFAESQYQLSDICRVHRRGLRRPCNPCTHTQTAANQNRKQREAFVIKSLKVRDEQGEHQMATWAARRKTQHVLGPWEDTTLFRGEGNTNWEQTDSSHGRMDSSSLLA